ISPAPDYHALPGRSLAATVTQWAEPHIALEQAAGRLIRDLGVRAMTARQEFDYVIIGAGSAGCVLAARLSQDPAVKIALVEAGGPDDAPEIAMPAAFPRLFKTQFDWDLSREREQG